MRFFRPDDFCSKKLVQQEVGTDPGRRLTNKHEEAVKAKFRSRRGSLAAVVGLQGSGSDKRICTGGLCFGHQEFQFAGLVAAKGKTGLVVAFDQ